MRRLDFLALLTRLFLGYLFVTAGLCKLTEGVVFNLIGPPGLIKSLAPHGLVGFGVFLAVSQVMIGALVLSQRYSLLGLVGLMPINACMVAVTISQNWSGTPYVDSLFLLMNVLVLLYEWNTLKVFLLPNAPRSTEPPRTNQLFPNRWLPLAILVTALLACAVAQTNAKIALVLVLTCFVLTYANVWMNKSLLFLDRIMLVLSLLATSAITLARPLRTVHINAHQLFGLAVLAGFFLLLASIWQSRRTLSTIQRSR